MLYIEAFSSSEQQSLENIRSNDLCSIWLHYRPDITGRNKVKSFTMLIQSNEAHLHMTYIDRYTITVAQVCFVTVAFGII